VGRKERNFLTFSVTYCTSGSRHYVLSSCTWSSRHAVTGIIYPVPDMQTLLNMQGYPYDIWTVKFWTVKFPGDICIVEIWTVKTGLGGLGLRLRLGLRLVMTVQFMVVQILTVQLRHLTREQQPPIFGPCLLSSNGWMDQHAIWYGLWTGGMCRPRPRCVRWEPSSPIRDTATCNPLNFSRCLLWPYG